MLALYSSRSAPTIVGGRQALGYRGGTNLTGRFLLPRLISRIVRLRVIVPSPRGAAQALPKRGFCDRQVACQPTELPGWITWARFEHLDMERRVAGRWECANDQPALNSIRSV